MVLSILFPQNAPQRVRILYLCMKDKIYTYRKTGNRYKVIGDEAKMKDPSSREWIKCIIYQSQDTGDIYVRALDEFLERFDEVINQ